MPDPSNQVFHFNDDVGTAMLSPVLARLQATWLTGAVTKDSTRRRSDPTITITKTGTGTYAVAGLPTGVDGHILGLFVAPGTAVPDSTKGQECQPFNYVPNAGTVTLVFTRPDTGAVVDPEDNARLFLSILVETGAYV